MSAHVRPSRRRNARPTCEPLEGRSLLSATSILPGAGPTLAAEVRAAQATTATPLVPTATVSTVPANGDVNPYGVAFVPKGFPKGGTIHPGDVLVSNFN